MEHQTQFASKGVAGTGLGLGIAGTALGVLNSGGLGNILGGGTPATDTTSALQAEIGMLKAERYADSVAISAYKNSVEFAEKADNKISKVVEKLANQEYKQGVMEARTEEQLKCLNERVHRNFIENKQYTDSAVALEAERRACGDENLSTYFNGVINTTVADFNAKLAWKAEYAPYIDGSQVFCPNKNICNTAKA